MKNRIAISISLLLVTTLCFAQQSKPIAELPAKGTLMQTTSEKVSAGDAATVAEGKKGLNAVNVKLARQAGSANENEGNKFPPKNSSTKATKYACMNPALVDSDSNASQAKHATNTKGTGATKNK